MHRNLERPVARGLYRLLTIDPGLSGTGYAVWCVDQDVPANVGIVPDPPRNLSFEDRARDIAEWLFDLKCGYDEDPYVLVCEFPEFQASAHREMGWRTGDLQKLTFLVGVIAGRMYKDPFVSVTPHVWKGQLPKDVVARRITARLGTAWVETSGVESHAWDAVGIGLWWRDYGHSQKVQDATAPVRPGARRSHV